MSMSGTSDNGLVLGAWGAVQATAIGGGVALGGALRDLVDGLAVHGHLGEALSGPAVGYGFVYQLEVDLAVRSHWRLSVHWSSPGSSVARSTPAPDGFGLDQMPG
jgi:BCD family chlorophyll transporter-like MFS transporter